MAYDREGHGAWFIAPEDVVVAKVRAYEATESDRQLRDGQSVVLMQWGELDLELMRRSARVVDVVESLEQLLDAARREIEQ